MRGAAPYLQAMPIPNLPDLPGLVNLNVGGKSYASTSHTLLAAPNSFFWELLIPGPQVGRVCLRAPPQCVCARACVCTRAFLQAPSALPCAHAHTHTHAHMYTHMYPDTPCLHLYGWNDHAEQMSFLLTKVTVFLVSSNFSWWEGCGSTTESLGDAVLL